MWWRRVIELSFSFILVFSSSIVLSQSNKVIPDRQVLSIDSLRAKVGRVPHILKPAPVVIKREEPGSEEANLNPNQPPVTSGSSYEQWVTYRFSYTNWSWHIRKPGTFAGKVVEGFVESNGDVIVDFAGFGNLGLHSTPSHTADNYFALAHPSSGIRDLKWITPSELNATDIRVGNSDPTWSTWVLWHRVDIIEDTSAEDIDGGGTISIKLQNNFPYLDNYPFAEPTRILK